MKNFDLKKMRTKIIGLFFALLVLVPTTSIPRSNVGQVNTTREIERVTLSYDGKLYAWDKQGVEIEGWPIDLSGEERFFSYPPRLFDVDGDLQQEILAVSENEVGTLRFHVYKGDASELDSWRFDLPHTDLTEPPIIADINHDSSFDIIYGTESGDIHAFRRDFVEHAPFSSSLGATSRVLAGDPDNDGQDDLFATAGSVLYHWNQVGSREIFYELPVGEEIIGNATIVDVTRDAYPEILFATTQNRIVAIDRNKQAALEVPTPEGITIVSPLLVEDVDFDLEPELLFLSDENQIVAIETAGSFVTDWSIDVNSSVPGPTGGLVANDLYRGAFLSDSGLDHTNVYRSKLGGYSRIELGKNVHDWDLNAPFNFIEAIEINDVIVFPLLFTPNGDGINDTTELRYHLSEDAQVAVELYDNKERFISRIYDYRPKDSGFNTDSWNGVDNRGTLTPNDDIPLDTGRYILRILARSSDGFVSTARVSAVLNGIKAEIEVPRDDDRTDTIYPVVHGQVSISGTAMDPNFGEGNLNADFHSYKLYYRTGNWLGLTAEEVIEVGESGSAWIPIPVPLLHQSPTNVSNEPNDRPYPNSNVSVRPVQHGLLGSWDTQDASITPNGEYTLLLKTLDSNGNTVGRVNYDLVTVTIHNPNAGDPFDADNPFDLSNPDNPLYQGPNLTNITLSNDNISRAQPTSNIGYRLENETSHINITIYRFDGGEIGRVVSSYSFNHRAIGDYSFVWNGQNTLGRNVNGGTYRIRITATAVDGTGSDSDESLTVNVALGFAASDILDIESFLATPDIFRPLSFGGDLEPESASIHYGLTKRARISIQVFDGIPEEGGILQRTLVSEDIQRTGSTLWDGSADNGVILPLNRDYVVRLVAEGIDIGNDELVHEDITVRLEQQTLSSSLSASIAQLRGKTDEILDNDGSLRSLEGNSDFLWRAQGTGHLDLDVTYSVTAMGEENYYVYTEIGSPVQRITKRRGDPCSYADAEALGFAGNHYTGTGARRHTIEYATGLTYGGYPRWASVETYRGPSSGTGTNYLHEFELKTSDDTPAGVQLFISADIVAIASHLVEECIKVVHKLIMGTHFEKGRFKTFLIRSGIGLHQIHLLQLPHEDPWGNSLLSSKHKIYHFKIRGA